MEQQEAKKSRLPARLGGGKRKNRDERKAVRRASALERAAARAETTAEQQLAKLDGWGFRAVKERARLQKEIANGTA